MIQLYIPGYPTVYRNRAYFVCRCAREVIRRNRTVPTPMSATSGLPASPATRQAPLFTPPRSSLLGCTGTLPALRWQRATCRLRRLTATISSLRDRFVTATVSSLRERAAAARSTRSAEVGRRRPTPPPPRPGRGRGRWGQSAGGRRTPSRRVRPRRGSPSARSLPSALGAVAMGVARGSHLRLGEGSPSGRSPARRLSETRGSETRRRAWPARRRARGAMPPPPRRAPMRAAR